MAGGNTGRMAEERKDRGRVRGREERNITLRLRYPKTLLHKRKCIQHHSHAMEETEIEKGKSEFAHLGKTSQWRQSISNSVLLKRARWKYSSSQHKRSWHTFQSIGYSQCAGKFLLKSIRSKLGNLESWRCSTALQKSHNQSAEVKLSLIMKFNAIRKVCQSPGGSVCTLLKM